MSTQKVGALIARAERITASRGSGIDFAQYADDPVRFAREVLKFDPWEKQQEVCDSYIRHKRTHVRGFHGAGKDAILSVILLHAVYCRGMLALAVSATEAQLLGQLWKEVRERFQAADGALPGELLSAELRINGVGRLLCRTSGNVSALTGYHDPNGVLVAISEAQNDNTEDAAFDAASANAVDDDSRIIVVGNPYKPSGRFYETHKRQGWHAIKIAAADHPNIRLGRIVVPGGPAPNWIQEVAAEYGEDSPWFVGRVLAEFPETSVDALFKRSWIDAAFERHPIAMNQTDYEMTKREILCDPAGPGVDRTCIGVRRGDVIESLNYLNVSDTMETAKYLADLSAEFGLWDASRNRERQDEAKKARARIVLDVAGLGIGIADRLSALGCPVDRFNAANSASAKSRFANKRAETFWKLREGLDKGTVALPRDETLAEELLAIEFGPDGAGKILIAPKSDIRSRLGRSPDKADTVSFAFGARSRTVMVHWPII